MYYLFAERGHIFSPLLEKRTRTIMKVDSVISVAEAVNIKASIRIKGQYKDCIKIAGFHYNFMGIKVEYRYKDMYNKERKVNVSQIPLGRLDR